MNSIHLTRHQRRQMKQLGESVDRITTADRRFFDRFQLRQHRVRLAARAEIEQQEILQGGPVRCPEGCRIFVVVKNVSPGMRLRLFTFGIEGAETDFGEAVARQIYDTAATPKTCQIEDQMRRAVGAGARA